VTFLIVALLSGIFFGIYCQVLVLIPATLAVAATYSVVALLDSGSAISLASLIVVPSVGLQGGYIIGLTSRDFLVPFLARGNGPQSKRI
jgi:hypothetical protein